jgi:hypothetical protein
MRATIVFSGLLTTAACLIPCPQAKAQTYEPQRPLAASSDAASPVEDWWAAPGNPERDRYLNRFSQRYSATPAQILPGYSSELAATRLFAQADQTAQTEPNPVPPASAEKPQSGQPAAAPGAAARPGQPKSPPAASPLPATPPAAPPAVPAPEVAPPLAPMVEPSPLSPFSALQAPPSPFLARLSRAPDMFGDSITTNSVLIDQSNITSNLNHSLLVDVPSPGGFARFKNEHARAMPTDRLFVLYNHFHNALDFQSIGDGTVTRSVNVVTLGGEKTFDGGRSSLEVRLPLVGFDDVNINGAGYNAEEVGDLVLALKTLLVESDDFAIASGIALSLPTAGDVSIALGGGDSLQIRNETFRLLPYLAFQLTPDENWFFHLFTQLDSTASANRFVYRSGGASSSSRITDQSLFYLDWSAGYWWYRNDDPDAEGLTGLASVFELHWTTAVNDAQGALVGNLPVIAVNNRFDALNATGGVHLELNHETALRVAAVLPLRQSRTDRFFDAEVQASLIHRF